MGLDQLPYFMAAIRRMESGSFGGNYRVVNEIGARGAYQILSGNWDGWAAQAGIPGADWRDPAAQDAVARYKFIEYYRRYGSWDLVAMAWHGGEGTVRKYLRTGQLGPRTTSYVRRYGPFMAEMENAAGNPPQLDEGDLRAGVNVRGRAELARRDTYAAASQGQVPWFYPIFLDPADQLAAFFESMAKPDTEEEPDTTSTLASVFQSISDAVRKGAGGSPTGPETSAIDLTKQGDKPDLNEPEYVEMEDQG